MKEMFMGKIEDQKIEIPDSEVFYGFARSGGKGGQNVNKRDTKATAYWDIDASRAFTGVEKRKIKQRWSDSKYITSEGHLYADSEEERSQFQNRVRAKEKLDEMVAEALEEEKERIPTERTAGSEERRLKEKKQQGEKKKERQESKKIDY